MEMLTQERLKEFLNYSPLTGVFTWAKSRPHCRIGDEAGTVCRNGYIKICLQYKSYLSHRLAWLYVHGTWPIGEIDHKNHKRSDNRINNLRDVSGTKNQENRISAHKNNSTGYLGVSMSKCGKRFRALIVVDKKQVRLGTYGTPQEAHLKYLEAKRKSHAGCMI
jgi:hypothetical protein